MKTTIQITLTACFAMFFFTHVYTQNVGIGTATPDQKLELEGPGVQLLRVHTTSVGSSGAGLELIRGGAGSGTDWKIINDGGVLKFYDNIDNFTTEGDENMRLTSSGNLGIGSVSPVSHVHIAGTTDQLLTIHKTTTGFGLVGIDLLRGSGSGTDWRFVNDGGVLKFLDGIDNFATPGTENMRITQSGNVGIGVTSPESRLHVNGTLGISTSSGGQLLRIGSSSGNYLAFDNNEIAAKNSSDEASTLFLQYWGGNLSLCNLSSSRVGIGTISPDAKLHITDGSDVTLAGGGQLVLGPVSGSNIAFDGNEILARDNGGEAPLFVQIDGGDVLLTPNENGQVGIGVTSMATMPNNDFLLAVDGKIISEEVRVEMSGSWPDYVFKEDYNLKPLSELEKEIITLGHLPGVPEASLIEEEGFELGDMQRRMVEKIEELTLYMIKADKEIQALKASNASLQKQVDVIQLRD